MSSKTTKIPFVDTVQVAMEIFKSINSPRSLAVFMLCDSYLVTDRPDCDSFARELKGLSFNVNWYDQYTISRFRDDYCATVLLSKLPPCDDSSVLSDRAILGFKEGEELSRSVTTEWLNPSRVESRLFQLGVRLSDIQDELRRILGRAPSWQTLSDKGYFTEGASVLMSRLNASAARKCEEGRSITLPLASRLQSEGVILNPMINSREGWFLSPGNLVTTVPKNIETNRTIAMEPEINAFFQRAVGDHIRQRLKRCGIDLNDQTLNQRACLAAMSCQYATIDLRNASNSVNARVCEELLPKDWFDIIDCCRSQRGAFDSRSDLTDHNGVLRHGDWFEYSMLSSMGNGFTFELESALFYAICLACGSPAWDTYIYGDDIIIPQSVVTRLVDVLKVCGFEVNYEKSFTSGAFFESCGTYAFHNVDVTPFKIKDLLYGNKACIVLANKIRWFSHSSNNFNGCDRRYLSAYRMCTSRLSRTVRLKCRGPVDSGLTLWSNRNEVSLQYSRKRGMVRCGQLVPKRAADPTATCFVGLGLLAFRLFEQESRGKQHHPVVRWSFNTLPASERRLNVVKDYYSGFQLVDLWLEGMSWYDLGLWRNSEER